MCCLEEQLHAGLPRGLSLGHLYMRWSPRAGGNWGVSAQTRSVLAGRSLEALLWRQTTASRTSAHLSLSFPWAGRSGMLLVTPHRCSSSQPPTSLAGEQIPGSPKVKASICVWSQPGLAVVIRPAGNTGPCGPRSAPPTPLPWPRPASELCLWQAQSQPWLLLLGCPFTCTQPGGTSFKNSGDSGQGCTCP